MAVAEKHFAENLNDLQGGGNFLLLKKFGEHNCGSAA
jgi:hypothetical protein